MTDALDDDKLDELMCKWASQHAASENKLDDLAQRIGAQLNELLEPSKMVASPRHSSRRNFALAAAAAAGIAASIAVLFYLRPFSAAVPAGTKAAVRANNSAGADPLAPIDEQVLAEKARIAHEFEQEFPGRFAWLMEAGDEIKLGLTHDVSMRPPRFIAIRFVIESQGPDDRDWKPVWALDILTLSQETVQTSLPSNHGASVAIWTYATPDGMISVDSELTLSGPVSIRVSSSRLLSAGAPAEIWQSEQDGVKYRVYQAAEVLDKEQLG